MNKNIKCTNSKIKYIVVEVDEDKKYNVIVQKSFDLDYEDIVKFFGEMMEKFSQNTFPIIVIESFNRGGYGIYPSILQKVLNINLQKKTYSQY